MTAPASATVPEASPVSAELVAELAGHRPAPSDPAAFPADQLRRLADADVLRWTIPAEHGGLGLAKDAVTLGYRDLAAGCLTTAFVLTQRNAAVARLAMSDNDALKAEMLPALARGDRFATVGISHLTTSRQHAAKPVVSATPDGGDDDGGDGFRLSGVVPWTTAAGAADDVLVGAVTEDGRQLLGWLAADTPGVRIGDPAELMALSGSRTGQIFLEDAPLPAARLVAGPEPDVMGTRGGAGSLTTSALALGLTRAALALLETETARRDDLAESLAAFLREEAALLADLREALADSESHTAGEIRQRANSLCLRSTQATLAATKGAGFVAGHPAGRFVREAMFFLVWSCPAPVMQANLREFACLGG